MAQTAIETSSSVFGVAETASSGRGTLVRRFAIFGAGLFTVYLLLGMLVEPSVARLPVFWALWGAVMVTAMVTYSGGVLMRRSSEASPR